jgi:hypothetical protein
MKIRANQIPALFVFIGLFLIQLNANGQNSTESEYLNSKQNKSSFDNKSYKGLKEKIVQESSNSKSNKGSNSFDAENFSHQKPSEGSHYDYQEEEYKGEYDEFNSENENEEGSIDSEYNSNENNDKFESNEYDYYEKEYNEDGYNDYQQSKPSESIISKIKPQKIAKPTSGEAYFMQILLLVVGAILIAFLIYYFFLRFNVDEKGAKIISEQDIPPMEIPKSELERRLEKALKEGNFKEAVRIYFIFIIKDLSEKKWISWEKDKTNFFYILEMRKRPQYNLFNDSVFIFEWVWYGNYQVTEENYKNWEKTFKKLLSEINK